MTSLAGRVLATIRQRALFADGSRVAAAVSGGADSVALAHLLSELSAAGALRLVGIAHLNHRLRGEASDADAAFCARMAADCGVPFDTEAADVAALAARPGRSLEEAARELRYAFLERARLRLGADVVAVGHTLDDQAETVLMRVLRGAGPRGLMAIHPRRDHVVRPLIDLRRRDLEGYLESRGHPWVLDASNDDRGRRRNRLRHDLLPALIRAEGDGVVDVLARSADLAAADETLLEELTDAALARVATAAPPWRIDRAALALEPEAIRRRVLRRALARASGRTPTVVQVTSALRWLDRGRPGVLALSGVRLELSPARGVLLNTGSPPEPGQFSGWKYQLAVPGELAVAEAGVRVRAALNDEPMAGLDASRTARVERAAVGESLVVRAWQPGDRMRIAGAFGRKKVQDLFVDRKVPRAERHRVPIVTAPDGRIVWVAGHALSREFRATGATKSVVVLSFEPLGGL